MSAKERGVLSKYPSDMTPEEDRIWDKLISGKIRRITQAVQNHNEKLQEIEDDYERAMFEAGLWEYYEENAK